MTSLRASKGKRNVERLLLQPLEWPRRSGWQSRTYRFNLTTSGGIRIYVDDVLVGQRWIDDGGSYLFYLNRAMTAGTHKITLEYLETSGLGRMALSW
jgi:hypothetical protein